MPLIIPEGAAQDFRARVSQASQGRPVTVAVLDVRRTTSLAHGDGLPQRTASLIEGRLGVNGSAAAVDAGAVLVYSLDPAVELRRAIDETRHSAELWGLLAGVATGEVGEGADSVFSRALDALGAARHQEGMPTRTDPGLFTRRRAVAVSLEAGEFRLVFQPIVQLSTRKAVGAEALLRWTHPVHGEQNPGQFIPWLETSGAIIEVGQWVLAEALATFAHWHAHDVAAPSFISINISGIELLDPDFARRTLAALAAVEVEPTQLCLEIVESSVGGISDGGRENLVTLREHGVRIALDDFGVGTSNFERMLGLPADTIKIDRQFLASGVGGRRVIEAILELSEGASLSTVTEGIERAEQAEWLMDHGCELGQGFLYSPGVPGSDFASVAASLSNGELAA
jgi:EAL domain-containing protein (putative c-di-GMP-specific phosphodiesterase class I)